MALSTGTVSVDADGVVTGSGFARDLYEIEAAGFINGALYLEGDLDAAAAAYPGAGNPGATRDALIAWRVRTAAKCSAQATKLVALVKTASVTVVVPSTPITVTNGTVS